MNSRPNILWICTEHQRFDTVGALGNPHIRTPNLDRLVDEGVAFTHAFCQNPVCTPSRSSFLTGRYPSTTLCRQNGQNIPDSEIPITQVLRDLGYDCGLAGKLHVSAAQSGRERRIDDGYRMFQWSHGSTEAHGGEWVRWLEEQGLSFDEVYRKSPILLSREIADRRYHQTTWCFEQALDFVQQERKGPWLASINPFAAHDPFDFLPEYYERYDASALPPPIFRAGELDNKPYPQQARYRYHPSGGYESTTVQQRCEMKAAYYATIEHIDDELGRVLDWLDESRQRENTLIIFMADHGEMLGDHGIFTKGPFFYDPAVRIPLILSWPGSLPRGKKSDALVELVDVAPTLYSLLELEIPVRVQGQSLMPVISDSAASEHRDGVYCEYYNSNPPGTAKHRTPTYATMWRTRTHKIVVYHGETYGELYDLETDPREFDNLWERPDCAALRSALLKECFDARVFTMDPLPERIANF